MPGSAVPLPGPAQRRARRPRRRQGRPLRRAVHGAFAGPAGAGQGPREARLCGGRSSGGGDHGATCAWAASISYHRAFAPARSHPSPLAPRSPERPAAGAVEMKREEGARRDAIGRNHEEARLLMFHVDHTAAPSSRTPCRGGSAAVLLCLALLLTALALTSPAEAKKVPKGFFGIAPGVAHLDSKDYKKMRKTKIETSRVWVFWKSVEPQRGSLPLGRGRRSGERARQERDHSDPDDLGSA